MSIKSQLGPLYAKIPPNYRIGKSYRATSQLLARSQYWTREKHQAMQLRRLRLILQHCNDHVPFYKELFSQCGFEPGRLSTVEDLRALPLLDRETIRENLPQLLAENIPRSEVTYSTTGGTMGRPIGLFNHKSAGGRELAYMHAMWARVGYHWRDDVAALRGRAIQSSAHWAYYPTEGAYYFSNFHLTPEHVREYARVMKVKGLRFLHSYPSAISDFGRQLQEQGIEPPRFTALLASSENIYLGQREYAETMFGSRFFSWYGHSENLILAGECEHSTDYHVFPEYGVVELIKEDGSSTQPGEWGELVGTTLENFAMPLVRYRTEDWAMRGPEHCLCGRPYELLRGVNGRWLQEVMIGKNGNRISATALNIHTSEFDNVEQFQFYQPEQGSVVVRLKPKANFTKEDEANICEVLTKKMGDTMDVSIAFVSEIAKTPAGKYKYIVREQSVSWENAPELEHGAGPDGE